MNYENTVNGFDKSINNRHIYKYIHYMWTGTPFDRIVHGNA